jgi:hypothetical protein
MTTVIILLVILCGGGLWMYRQGKSSAMLDQAEADLEGLTEINEMGKDHDTETDDILAELDALSNGPPKLPPREGERRGTIPKP